METAALLLPLVAGWLYVSICAQLKYKQSREDGHRLYFRIAYCGVLLFILSASLLWVVHWFLSDIKSFQQLRGHAVDFTKGLVKETSQAPSQLAFFVASAATLGLGPLLAWLDNVIFKSVAQQALYDAAAKDELELLLLEAAVQYKSISVTTSSSKVYVGIVLGTGEPKTDRRVIALLPYMSGYRTETGKVNFTTFYDEIYRDRAQERDDEESNDFRLVLPIDKMVSVSFFDIKVYEAFSAKAKAKPPLPRRVKVPRRIVGTA